MSGFDQFVSATNKRKNEAAENAPATAEKVRAMLDSYTTNNLMNSDFLGNGGVHIKRMQDGYAVTSSRNGFLISATRLGINVNGEYLALFDENAVSIEECENELNAMVLRSLQNLGMLDN